MVIGTRGAPDCVSLDWTIGARPDVLSRCSCGWTQANVTEALAELRASAHLWEHAAVRPPEGCPLPTQASSTAGEVTRSPQHAKHSKSTTGGTGEGSQGPRYPGP